MDSPVPFSRPVLMRPKPFLAYTVAFDAPGSGGCRQMARMLGASMARTLFGGDFLIVRNSPEPLFLVQREGVREYFVEVEGAEEVESGNRAAEGAAKAKAERRARMAMEWKALVAEEVIGETVEDYSWVLFVDVDCLLAIIGYDPEAGATAFRGTIQCDGYSAYQALVARYGGILLGGCLAHIRRKFLEAGGQAPEVTLPVLRHMQELYRIEEQLRKTKAPPDCRMLVRRARGRPIVKEIKAILDRERTRHLPKSKLGEAIGYALNQWEKFARYLDDGTLEIDNNLVENAIRPTKLGLKNSLFFGSAEAGTNNALLYTLIENCKRQGLDPQGYLAEAIKRLPANATPEQAAALTPARIAAERRNAELEAA